MAVRAANLNIYLMRGDDYPYEFNVDNSDGTAYNAAGSTVTITIKDIVDGSQLYQANAADAALGNNFAGGIFVFVIPNATTATINTDAVYDIQETTAANKKNTLVYGKILVTKDVNS
jgi:hypothetical protein